MIKKVFISFVLFFSNNLFSFSLISSYDRATVAAQKGQWNEAKKEYVHALIDQPQNADFLYDLGVASYQTEDFDKADAYFKKAAEHASDNAQLKEQAYFNRGNTLVKRKKLKEALEQYENALALNPDNEKAAHNREIVKALLEEEKQQDGDNNSPGGDQGNQQQQEPGNGGDNSQDNQSGNDEQNNEQDQENGEDQENNQNDNSKNENSEQKDSQDEQGGDGSHESEDDVDREDDGDDHQDEQSQHDSSWDTDNDAQNKDEGQQNDQQDKGGHDETSCEKDDAYDDEHGAQGQDTSAQDTLQEEEGAAGGAAEMEEGEEGLPLDDWAIKLLQERDNEDAALNKKMIKAAVGKKETDASGKNCW